MTIQDLIVDMNCFDVYEIDDFYSERGFCIISV